MKRTVRLEAFVRSIKLPLFVVLVASNFHLTVEQLQQEGGFIGIQDGGSVDFLSGLQATDGMSEAQGLRFQMSAKGFKDINWMQIDRRAEEGWWHLYPFGERFNDLDMGSRPWNDQQIDLDFFFPFYGFRFNYTFIFPEGFVAFAYPNYIQPPYTFPTPSWPDKPDPSLVAAFMTEQSFMHIGETKISHVWYRVIQRPINFIGRSTEDENQGRAQQTFQDSTVKGRASVAGRSYHYGGQLLKQGPGRVEDPLFLDQLSDGIHRGMVGARGFRADYALIVTWERMGYGGTPKSTRLNEYESVKKSQNTYQVILASDEIRSYVMFNYAHINWTSSTAAGSLAGRGGKQSAIVGFNGGNGTGFVHLPYSAEGNSYKLVQFGSTQTAGRWLSRVDESIIYGGCTNTSTGILQPHCRYATMLGGFALNVSGPCLRSGAIKLQVDEVVVDCEKIDMVVARCVIPVNSIFRVGPVKLQLSTDGGKSYPFWTDFFILQPSRSRNLVNLLNDPINLANNWMHPSAENLTLQWSAFNISSNPNAQVDITLWGYWEDVEGHDFVEVGSIARKTQNTGVYSFNPRTLSKTDMMRRAWRRFQGGVIQVRVSDNWMADRGDGSVSTIYWSRPITFSWYFRQAWERHYGSNWALDICREWFSYDGKRRNFIKELEPVISCPCTLGQAQADFGRFTPLHGCDAFGNSECRYTRGAWHCVVSTHSVWTGAGQMCCYDRQGWLMFTDDYEYNDQYLRFYAAGFPFRAHPWGSYPYKRPPFVPTMSNFYNDILPYEYCCKWAGKCEFFYWRRQSSGCQEYRPPKLGFAYGQSHFITYDGLYYPFHGKGYYVLTMMKGPRRDLMVQVRLEQPPKTIWDEDVKATVITGVAARDNQSATVQVFARKEFRRWRYKMDVYVDGARIFFDMFYKKLHNFKGVSLFSPHRNTNTSEIHIMFTTGVGIKVMESRGVLYLAVALPPSYNETLSDPHKYDHYGAATYAEKCVKYTRTMGLLGTFNDDIADELVTPDCTTLAVAGGNSRVTTESESRQIYNDFGLKWEVDGVKYPMLFQIKHKPLYNPGAFASKNYKPMFDMNLRRAEDFYTSLIFDKSQVKVACQDVYSCKYDYISSGRKETALDTLSAEKKFEGEKARGEEKLISCGPLVKNRGVVKYPVGNNYLDGVTVTFTCKPEYFLHGEEQRKCENGTWSPGWWVWCRERSWEIAIKWMCAIFVSLLIIAIIAGIFLWCYCMRISNEKTYGSRRYKEYYTVKQRPGGVKQVETAGNIRSVNMGPSRPPMVPVMESNHGSVAIHGQRPYIETSA